MSARLGLAQIALLISYAVAMAGGQLLFKLAAARDSAQASPAARLVGLMLNGYFIAALAGYALLAVLWVWILTFTPLSRAYPFVAVAFALTPLLAGLVFSEPISLRLVLGLAVILVGLVLIGA
jgi:drug/metabolite transporter (DMT)-like permease